MKVEDTKIYAVLKEVFEGTPDWQDVYENLKEVVDTNNDGQGFEDREKLIDCFVWYQSAKGQDYWLKISSTSKSKNETQKPLISMDKQYTRNGKKVRVLCVDRNYPNFPVLTIDADGSLAAFTSTGQSSPHRQDEELDLKEYNPWQDVAVDTKVYVKFFSDEEHSRHFSHYKDGTVYVYVDGRTSFTAKNTTNVCSARLA